MIPSSLRARSAFVPPGVTHDVLTPARPERTHVTLTRDDVHELVAAAYVYTYPLVLMDVTRDVMTSVPCACEYRAPLNQFAHARSCADAAIPHLNPEAGVLLSSAWVDLGPEPIVLGVPDFGRRYFLLQMADAWTNVFGSLGTRTSGNGSRDVAIVGPGWAGTLPPGMKAVRSSTTAAWMSVRIQTAGRSDYSNVHLLQRQLTLTPLSAWGKQRPLAMAASRSVDAQSSPVEQVDAMDPVTYFRRANRLLQLHGAPDTDLAELRRFAAIGVGAGLPFDLRALDPLITRSLHAATRAAQLKIASGVRTSGTAQSPTWTVLPRNTGRFGKDYTTRAALTHLSGGAHCVTEDVFVALGTRDAHGERLSGGHRYALRFPANGLPPAYAFWNISIHNAAGGFTQNAIDRFAIGDRDQLTFNHDGSLTLRLQHTSPGARNEANWLPCPAGQFTAMLRVYWPTRQVLDASWAAPAIERLRDTR